MARYSKCTVCGDKTDTYVGFGNVKIGPCCTKPEKSAMFIVGIKNQEELTAWYKKFRPGKEAPQMKTK